MGIISDAQGNPLATTNAFKPTKPLAGPGIINGAMLNGAAPVGRDPGDVTRINKDPLARDPSQNPPAGSTGTLPGAGQNPFVRGPGDPPPGSTGTLPGAQLNGSPLARGPGNPPAGSTGTLPGADATLNGSPLARGPGNPPAGSTGTLPGTGESPANAAMLNGGGGSGGDGFGVTKPAAADETQADMNPDQQGGAQLNGGGSIAKPSTDATATVGNGAINNKVGVVGAPPPAGGSNGNFNPALGAQGTKAGAAAPGAPAPGAAGGSNGNFNPALGAQGRPMDTAPPPAAAAGGSNGNFDPSMGAQGRPPNPGTAPGAGATNGGTSDPGATGTGSTNPLSWRPTTGIIDQIAGITPQQTQGEGTAAATIADTPQATSTGYDAVGYTAQQGTAQTSNENVSSAVDRIIDANSPIMQQARAQATDAAGDRGLSNSTMAVQAGQSAVLQNALPMAQGDVQNAQFNAQQQNVMTINNVDEANKAAAFHADATNQASQFAAAAKNSVSQFNSAQAQAKATESAQLWQQAAQFSAAAKQAAETFNAQSYNDAMQRYVDAKNAAVAAQNDAENLSRRDTSQINAGLEQAHIGANATVSAAQAHASATVAAAQIGAAASAANLDKQIASQQFMQTQALNQDLSKFNASMSQQQQQFASTLSSAQFNQFQTGLSAIMTQSLEPDAKQNAISNYMAVWTASKELPFNINQPGATTPPPGP